MHKAMIAYMLNDSDTVVTKKSTIRNTKDSDFTTVRLIVSMDEIKDWAEEIEMMGLDEEDEEEEWD